MSLSASRSESQPSDTAAPRTLDALQAPALWTLIVLQATMAASLFTQTPPHPPLEIPLFAIAPFLGASLGLAAAALSVPRAAAGWHAALGLAAAFGALLSFGPQKWFDPALPQIWPAVLLGELAALVVVLAALRGLRRAAL